jgi:epoxyqueuosine reductase
VTAEQLKARAKELGFSACGITTPDPLPSRTAEQLDRWLASGMAGTMRYLHRQARRRRDPRRIVEGARSVVVVLATYNTNGEPPGDPLGRESRPATGDSPRTARYARGLDYHAVVGARLDELTQWLIDRGAATARPFLDAGPVPEREMARRAGLGWVGKNTMLIRPGLGSWTFIGSVFTDLALEPDQAFEADHCGSCTRCLQACPTAAFPEPGVLDASRCISYLTIEQKGPISAELAPKLGGWAFGCDICNEVCPWNLKFAEPTPFEGLLPRPETDLTDLPEDHFSLMTDEEFEARYGRTAFARPGRLGMDRNLKAALGSRHPAPPRPPAPGTRHS